MRWPELSDADREHTIAWGYVALVCAAALWVAYVVDLAISAVLP